jgi:hypothetical protein
LRRLLNKKLGEALFAQVGKQLQARGFKINNLTGYAQKFYDTLYCQRGEAENRIKQAQVGLFATLTSCHHFQSNQLRMLLAALGYVLIERLRALVLTGTKLAARRWIRCASSCSSLPLSLRL